MSRKSERDAFNRGYLIACCNMQNLHDCPELASDVLAEAGLDEDFIARVNLSEYDASALDIIREAQAIDPISKAEIEP